jgi:hypothetical protein
MSSAHKAHETRVRGWVDERKWVERKVPMVGNGEAAEWDEKHC